MKRHSIQGWHEITGVFLVLRTPSRAAVEQLCDRQPHTFLQIFEDLWFATMVFLSPQSFSRLGRMLRNEHHSKFMAFFQFLIQTSELLRVVFGCPSYADCMGRDQQPHLERQIWHLFQIHSGNSWKSFHSWIQITQRDANVGTHTSFSENEGDTPATGNNYKSHSNYCFSPHYFIYWYYFVDLKKRIWKLLWVPSEKCIS